MTRLLQAPLIMGLAILLALGPGCGTPGTSSPYAPAVSRKGAAQAESAVTDVTVNLNPGWNGIGFQATQFTSLSANSRIAGVTSFTGGSYQTRNFTTSDLNSDSGGRRGFWVFATAATSFTYSGTGGPGFVDLVTGYNLVSFATSSDIPGSSLTAAVNNNPVPTGSVMLPTFFEIGPNNVYTPVDISSGGTVKAGRAYWIFASTAARLNAGSGPFPTPSPSPTPALSFTVRSSGSTESLSDVTFGNAQFVAVGGGGHHFDLARWN